MGLSKTANERAHLPLRRFFLIFPPALATNLSKKHVWGSVVCLWGAQQHPVSMRKKFLHPSAIASQFGVPSELSLNLRLASCANMTSVIFRLPQ